MACIWDHRHFTQPKHIGASVAADTADTARAGAQPPQVPAASQVLRILSYLATQRGPVAAAMIAQALRIPRSTTYHLLRELELQHFVWHSPEARRYGLGVAAFELSSGYLRQEPLARIGAPILASLVDRMGESAHLAVLQERDVIYVVEERARHRPTLITDVGVRLPSELTASGRAMLAELPASQVRALFPYSGAFALRGDAEPRTYSGLKKVLSDVRRVGFGFENGEVSEGIASVAVAVVNHAGWPVAAITTSFPTESFAETDWPELANELRHYSGELARRIGGRTLGGSDQAGAPQNSAGD